MSATTQLRIFQGALCVFLAGLFVSLGRGDSCDPIYCTNVTQGYLCGTNISRAHWEPDCVPCLDACAYVGDFGVCNETQLVQRTAPCNCPAACDCSPGRSLVEAQMSPIIGNWVDADFKAQQCGPSS